MKKLTQVSRLIPDGSAILQDLRHANVCKNHLGKLAIEAKAIYAVINDQVVERCKNQDNNEGNR